MKKFILFFIMLIISLGVKAQNFLELKSQEYRMASDSGKMKLDSIFCSLEKEWRDEQVKQIGGVAFGTSYDDAEIMFRNKFGKPVQSDRNKLICYVDKGDYVGFNYESLLNFYHYRYMVAHTIRFFPSKQLVVYYFCISKCVVNKELG